MGKYGYLINKQKVTGETMLSDNQVRNTILTNIANELAEGNRIERKNMLIQAFKVGLTKDERRQLIEELADQA